jgi:hypothetical protein
VSPTSVVLRRCGRNSTSAIRSCGGQDHVDFVAAIGTVFRGEHGTVVGLNSETELIAMPHREDFWPVSLFPDKRLSEAQCVVAQTQHLAVDRIGVLCCSPNGHPS